jgi:predicted phosphodiesterase
MANITHKWKRLLAVSCSHARYVDKEAWKAVLTFKERFKPVTTIHCGDFVDLTSLMSGAKGVSEAEPLIPDIDTGLQHLRTLQPQIVLCGNHEVRAFKLRASPSAPVAYASHKIVEAMEQTCQKFKARLVPYDGVFQVVDIADIGFTHGSIFNEMASRDMAETYCNTTRRKIVFGHTHKVSIQSSRTLTGGTGYNIGTLTQRGGMDYANTRRATLAWTQAFLWGEYCEELNQSSLHITQRNPNEQWRLPL